MEADSSIECAALLELAFAVLGSSAVLLSSVVVAASVDRISSLRWSESINFATCECY